eukprot:Lithocolla_globosa_v1_NODE_752_length_3331_cov_1184.225275.p4 type:complete len:132 gc:universal NODE_752_length_3331_cov_1184.225275:2324-1929(-)
MIKIIFVMMILIGKMKDETNGNPITEFVGLRAKQYCQQVHGEANKKVCKGIKKNVIRNKLTHEQYKQCVIDDLKTYNKMKTFRSYQHKLYTIETNKVSLCSYDNKRYTLDDGINTRAIGYYKNINHYNKEV